MINEEKLTNVMKEMLNFIKDCNKEIDQLRTGILALVKVSETLNARLEAIEKKENSQ